MQKEFKLTQERMTELETELTYLRTVREREVADQIREARSFGDLSENCEYDEAKNEQGRLFSRIAEIENVLNHAVLLEAEDITGDVVITGSHVKVRDLETSEETEYYIVGSQEADPMENRISDESPFGKALIGHKVGSEVKLNVPLGTLRFSVVAIS